MVGETIRSEGGDIEVYWGESGEPFPHDAMSYDGMIIMGGAMNAADDDRCPYFPDLTSLIRAYTEREKPVLGICLGAQLIARAFDAPLHLAGDFEFGFETIEPTEAAAADPVLSRLERPLSLFQWHTDHYDLPPCAVHLATNGRYENQAFRVGRATYATQFHFEVDRSVVYEWIDHNVEDLAAKKPGYEDWLPDQFEAHEENSKAFCRDVTGRWMALAG